MLFSVHIMLISLVLSLPLWPSPLSLSLRATFSLSSPNQKIWPLTLQASAVKLLVIFMLEPNTPYIFPLYLTYIVWSENNT